MKKITLNNKEYLLVEVPDDAHDFYINNIGCIRYSIEMVSSVIEPIQIGEYLEKDKHTVIGSISDILKDEDVCKGLVDKSKEGTKRYKNYKTFRYGSITAVKSFLAYLQSIDLDMTKQYLLIQKL